MPSLFQTLSKPAAAASSRRRGSVLVLVVAVLVLMAILGTAYLQVTRVQRLGIQDQGDIDAVMDSVLVRIENQLRDDLLDEDGRVFNQGNDDANNGTGFDEPYDYPWTNTAITGQREATGVLTGNDYSSGGNAIRGGRFDDPWLASSSPDFSENIWPQITSLTGYYVGRAGGESDLGNYPPNPPTAASAWSEFPVSESDTDPSTTIDSLNASFNQRLRYSGNMEQLVDADGDGMGDSRWEFPPITQIGGVIYVSAVRIVDLGSMANAEAAMSPRGDDGFFDPFNDAPEFNHPGELDFHGFMREVLGTPDGDAMGGGAETELDELKDMIEHKLDLGSPPTDALVSLGDRQTYWLDATRRYGPFTTGVANAVTGTPQYADYANADEWALRRRGGLADNTADATLESQLTAFLGATADTAPLASNADAQNHYDGPRPHVTVSSGAGVFAPRMSADGNAPQWKLDVNEASNDELRNAIVDVMSEGSPTLPAGFADATNFANQYVACLRDYADADNELTEYEGFFGMERLPAITDIYVQRRYEATEIDNGDWNGVGDQDYEMKWDAVGDTGFLVEIRNPWKRPITMDGVRLTVRDDNDNVSFTYSIGPDFTNEESNQLPPAEADGLLGPEEVLVLHKPSNGGNDAGNDDIADAADDADDVFDEEGGFTYVYVDMSGEDWPSAPDHTLANAGGDTEEGEFDTGTVAGSISVSLEAETTVAADDWLAYQRVNAVTMPDEYQQREMDLPGSPTGTEGYAAARTAGNADSLNMLLVTEAEWETTRAAIDVPELPGNLGGLDDRDVAANALGSAGGANKDGAGTAPDTPINPGIEQMIIADDRDGDDTTDDPIPQVGEVLLVTMLAPTGPSAPITPADATIAEVWADAATPSTLAEYRLDIGLDGTSPAVVSDSSGHGNDAIPHAAMLLERLTVGSPREDGVDNDGDGDTDEDTEAFVPGLINLNTAPRRVLESMIPIPNETMRSDLADAIINLRDSPGRTHDATGGGDPLMGIAHLAELTGDAEALMVDGDDTNTLDDDGNDEIEVDFLADPATGTAPNAGLGLGSGADGVVDDAEERARVLSWLYETASTRSDAYVAYVLVHGYRSGQVNEGPVESKRVIALFNRSEVENNTSGVLQAVFVVE